MSENEIIPISNQATELPNLIHVFLFYTRADENLISRPGTNGYVSKLPAICPYGRPKALLLVKIFCLRKHVSSSADCFTGMVSFFVVY
ncbi:hypothetical protein [Anaerostipes sp. 992a]|uniref:hypothetical protein n=1 Tax=Anaerostipes sp. 992a TaxID=1261637 RepID=UPI001178A4F7|nr:hypothetical protein [Anaerostipes sp. 992a]